MARRGEVEYIVHEPLHAEEEEEEEVIFCDSTDGTVGTVNSNSPNTSNGLNTENSNEASNSNSLPTDSSNKILSTTRSTNNSNLNQAYLHSASVTNSGFNLNTCDDNSIYTTYKMNGSNDQFDNSADTQILNKYYEPQDQKDFDLRLLGDENIVGFTHNELIEFYKNDRKFDTFPNNNKYISNNNNNNNNKIRLLSWNILADGDRYAMSGRHDYVPHEYREWNYRNIRIFSSIEAYNPDIVTLQEVTGNMYNNFIKTTFERIGYDTLHIPKDKNSQQSDTILYKSNRFELLKHQIINIGDISNEFDETYFGPEHNMFRNFLKSKNNTCILLMFKDIKTSKQFIICSAHLFWDPDRPHIKSAQMFILNQFLIDTLYNNKEWQIPNIDYTNKDCEYVLAQIPIIFSCDSNSVPSKVTPSGDNLFIRSGVNEIMYNSKLARDHLDHPLSQFQLRYIRNRNTINYEFNPELVEKQIEILQCIKTWKLTCNLHWRSVYNEFYRLKYDKLEQNSVQTNETIFTNKVPHFADTIDYIYVNKPVQLISILRMPYEKHIDDLVPILNVQRSCYDYPRYLQERHLAFNEFIDLYNSSINSIIANKFRIYDQLLFTGFIRLYVTDNLFIQLDCPLINMLMVYYCSSDKYEEHIVNKHDDCIFDQSYWRMLYASHFKITDNNNMNKYHIKYPNHNPIEFNAWNYPFMPNRKDPSDHFALCCDFDIIMQCEA